MNQQGNDATTFDSDAAPKPRFGRQFSVLTLLALTTVSAAVLALVRPLNLPPHVKLIFAGYAILMAAYVLLRGMALFRKSLRLRRQAQDRHRELETWLEEKKNASHAEPPPADPTIPTC